MQYQTNTTFGKWQMNDQADQAAGMNQLCLNQLFMSIQHNTFLSI